ncbi:2-amino-4-hydroxy-6-hydroxymethyldihydropteridine diphosphokinase [Blautia segnis]|uniref:Bifunctional folate synthesis protein n=1 Tax=Blautia segnis TaxID=2763030 RepID=A0A8I0AIS0_9FIRM|nr:2-amino-4-hydroxy-6-hydroxymethyldihydropteridine diphosphokinase [Blautia segnis]MBC5651104.1 2-amino-4-hydroxy-6-hydroxymethyldihydropteridine diphosphokinase [Blautia segnis]
MEKTRLDKIEIKELEVFANHGVYPEENILGQKFVISATLFTSTRQAGVTDDLSASINYGEVSHMITDFTRKHTFKLLEALAENLAEMLLCTLKGLEMVTLKIEKPWAPVGLPLKTVSVEITRKWHTAYIAFGSNMGDKRQFIDNGIRGLSQTKGCRIEAVSDYLITEPYGVIDQDEFLNGALKMRTLLTPEELLERLHQLEQEANRERIIHWGPRTLDLDILFYDQEIIDSPTLHIPHTDLQNRTFVLIPMNQIAPYLRHPVLNQTISQLLDSLS